MGYFDALSDLDFEELVADLMTAVHGVHFRAGPRGRDAGIDVVAETNDGSHVVQCKHYRKSTFAHLKNAMRKEVAQLTASRRKFASYRLATSMALTHMQRRELADLASPWIADPREVLDEGDLRALLRTHAAVEQRHVKLWIATAGALRRALGAHSYQRSRALLTDITASVPRYVQTGAFHQARQILEAESACVIAGPPGIGKTTIARLLLLDALESDYQPYEIVMGPLDDYWDLLDVDEPQIFLYDDFLGQTLLDDGRTSDRDLLRFVRAVGRKCNARLILTTREYIRQEAHLVSEILSREIDPTHRIVLQLPSLTRWDRARIFYNHLWSSPDVDDIAKDAILCDRAYLDVIDHEAFNPRVIEWACGLGPHRLSDGERRGFATFCLQALGRPTGLWEHAFEHGIGERERALLLAFPGLPARVPEAALEAAFDGSSQARGLQVHGGAFRKALQILEDSFVSSQRANGMLWVSVANPSLIDFLRTQIVQSTHDAARAVAGARFFDQVAWLYAAYEPPLREALALQFGDAFERTLGSHIYFGSSQLEIGDTTIGQRLGVVAKAVRGTPPLRTACASWLPSQVTAWLAAATHSALLEALTRGWVHALIDLDLLSADALGRRVLGMQLAEDVPWLSFERFELVARAWELAPSIIAPEMERELEFFIPFARHALNEPGIHLDDLDDLGRLVWLADTLGVELLDTDVASAVEWLPADDDWDSDSDKTAWTSKHDGYSTDPEIDALFQRLANDS